MLDNIGEKIKKLATIVTYVGIISSFICGISLFGKISWFFAILLTGIGLLSTWISWLLLYGFGDLICRVTQIEKSMNQIAFSLQSQTSDSHQKNSEQTIVEKWLRKEDTIS